MSDLPLIFGRTIRHVHLLGAGGMGMTPLGLYLVQRGFTVSAEDDHWNPATREMADHSIPYVVAAALIDGGVTLRSFDQAHLNDTQLRELLPRIEVLANDEFTRAHGRIPRTHHARVTVERADDAASVSSDTRARMV